jgi:hypothetical protein
MFYKLYAVSEINSFLDSFQRENYCISTMLLNKIKCDYKTTVIHCFILSYKL